METASQKIVREILKQIELGRLKIGDRLPSEREMAAALNVSRSSVREALSAMNMMGMTEIHPKGRTVLKPFHLAQFINTLTPLFLMQEGIDEQLKEYRLCIESEAARLAALRSDGSELRKILNRMKRCTNRKQADRLDLDFHLMLAACSGNQLLIQSSQAILSLIEHSVNRNRLILRKRFPDLKELIEQHEEILEAIENSDPESAVDRIQKHLSVKEEAGR